MSSVRSDLSAVGANFMCSFGVSRPNPQRDAASRILSVRSTSEPARSQDRSPSSRSADATARFTAPPLWVDGWLGSLRRPCPSARLDSTACCFSSRSMVFWTCEMSSWILSKRDSSSPLRLRRLSAATAVRISDASLDSLFFFSRSSCRFMPVPSFARLGDRQPLNLGALKKARGAARRRIQSAFGSPVAAPPDSREHGSQVVTGRARRSTPQHGRLW
jgi:hypothetical protein